MSSITKDGSDNLATRLACYQIKTQSFALFCVTIIAIVAMFRLPDPENVLINVIIAIGSFAAGRTDSSQVKRTTDKSIETEKTV
jgi:hypothetical protein